jgi:hypothetical protein
MAHSLVRLCIPVCFAVVGSINVAAAQMAADLSAPVPTNGLSVTSLGADLASHNGPASLGAGARGSRRAPGVGVSPARSSNPSLHGTPASSTFDNYGGSMAFHSASLSSETSRFNGRHSIPQDAASPALLRNAEPGLRSMTSTSIFGPHASSFGLDRRSASTVSPPRSFQSRSSIPERPLYSFLMRHEKDGTHSAKSRQALSSTPGHARKSRSSLIQSLTGAGGEHGSSR